VHNAKLFMPTIVCQAVPFDHPDWIYEIQHDGFRALAFVEDIVCRFVTPNNRRLSGFPDLEHLVTGFVRARYAILDGVIAVADPTGRTSFDLLMKARRRARYYAFDLLSVDGEDLRDWPLTARKERLQSIIPALGAPIVYVSHTVGRGRSLHRLACQQGLAGILAKRAASKYEPSEREWITIQNPLYRQRDEQWTGLGETG
jgi:bifunctional non-homologous end joining protein LigD